MLINCESYTDTVFNRAHQRPEFNPGTTIVNDRCIDYSMGTGSAFQNPFKLHTFNTQ